jgi:hypothetical protein
MLPNVQCALGDTAEHVAVLLVVRIGLPASQQLHACTMQPAVTCARADTQHLMALVWPCTAAG